MNFHSLNQNILLTPQHLLEYCASYYLINFCQDMSQVYAVENSFQLTLINLNVLFDKSWFIKLTYSLKGFPCRQINLIFQSLLYKIC